MREKLMEMLEAAHKSCCVPTFFSMAEAYKLIFMQMADYLIAHGAIIPPCKVGDKLYNKYSLLDDCCCWEVIKFEVYDDEIWIIDDSDNCYAEKEIGKTVFLSREEAEKALQGVE